MKMRTSTGLAQLTVFFVAWVFVSAVAPRVAAGRNDTPLGTMAPLGSAISQHCEPRAQTRAVPWPDETFRIPKDKTFEALFFATIGVLVFVVLIRLGARKVAEPPVVEPAISEGEPEGPTFAILATFLADELLMDRDAAGRAAYEVPGIADLVSSQEEFDGFKETVKWATSSGDTVGGMELEPVEALCWARDACANYTPEQLVFLRTIADWAYWDGPLFDDNAEACRFAQRTVVSHTPEEFETLCSIYEWAANDGDSSAGESAPFSGSEQEALEFAAALSREGGADQYDLPVMEEAYNWVFSKGPVAGDRMASVDFALAVAGTYSLEEFTGLAGDYEDDLERGQVTSRPLFDLLSNPLLRGVSRSTREHVEPENGGQHDNRAMGSGRMQKMSGKQEKPRRGGLDPE